MKKNKNNNAAFLGYKVNKSFLAEKLPFSQICGTNVGTSYKKRRHRETVIEKRERPKGAQSFEVRLNRKFHKRTTLEPIKRKSSKSDKIAKIECETCGLKFKERTNYKHHVLSEHEAKGIKLKKRANFIVEKKMKICKKREILKKSKIWEKKEIFERKMKIWKNGEILKQKMKIWKKKEIFKQKMKICKKRKF